MSRSSAEFERATTQLGFPGAMVFSNINSVALSDQRFWPLYATFQGLFQSINQKGGPGWVKSAISAPKILGGTVAGLSLFGITQLLRLPSLFFYGVVDGVTAGSNNWPPHVIPIFVGAWLGKNYFSRRFGIAHDLI